MREKEMLTTTELASRWGLNKMTLYKWRRKQKGPKYIKLGVNKGAAILYRIKDVEAYEKKYMVTTDQE